MTMIGVNFDLNACVNRDANKLECVLRRILLSWLLWRRGVKIIVPWVDLGKVIGWNISPVGCILSGFFVWERIFRLMKGFFYLGGRIWFWIMFPVLRRQIREGRFGGTRGVNFLVWGVYCSELFATNSFELFHSDWSDLVVFDWHAELIDLDFLQLFVSDWPKLWWLELPLGYSYLLGLF